MNSYVIMIEDKEGKRKLIQSISESDETIIYTWTKGNYSCDCNRSILFNDGDEDYGDNLYKITIFNNAGDQICSQI